MRLSDEEQRILTDSHYYLVKASVVRKLDEAFSDLKEEWTPLVASWQLPLASIDRTRGKIFRGENHKGFPYTLLDFPRHFSKEAVFAVRTMCWWGNEFSITLHLQGSALSPYIVDLKQRLQRLHGLDLFFCVNDTPWEYAFDEGNYVSLEKINPEEATRLTLEKGFLKISRKIRITDCDNLSLMGRETIAWYSEFLK